MPPVKELKLAADQGVVAHPCQSVGIGHWIDIHTVFGQRGFQPVYHFHNQPRALYDDVIMRTIVDLTDEQVKSLAALCAAQGISRAEAVRRAVARLLAEEHRPNRSQAFGAWSAKKLDRAATVRQLRDEWDR